MRIHSLELRNVRSIEHLHLADIPDTGVVVIHGHNEAGKTTITEAIRTVLKEKSDTKKTAVKAMQPVGKDVPVEITLSATVGETTFTVHKRYLRKSATTLKITSPRVESLTGGEADNRLARIIESGVDSTLFDALFVEQGDVDIALQAAGIPSLASALSQGESTSEHTDADPAILAAVTAEYQRYYTASTGREAGELKTARAEIATHQQHLQEATAAYSRLSGVVESVERDENRLRECTDELPIAEAELQQSQTKLAEALKLADDLSAARLQLSHAETAAEIAADAVKRRESTTSAVARNEAALAQRRQTLAELAEQCDALDKRIADSSGRRDQLGQRVATLNEQHNEARGEWELLQSEARRVELTDFLSEVAARDTELAALSGFMPATDITDDDLAALEKAEVDLKIAEATARAQAAKLTLTAASPTVVSVGSQEETIGEDVSVFEILEEKSFTIGEVTAVIAPGTSGQQLQHHVDQAKERLKELLDSASAQTVDHARETLRETKTKQEELAAKQRERAVLVGKKDVAALRLELQQLEKKVAGAQLPSTTIQDAKTSFELLSEQVAAATQEKKEADAEFLALKESPLLSDLRTQQLLIADEEQRLATLQAELVELEQHISADQLKDAEKKALLDVAAQREHVKTLQARVNSQNVATQQALVDGDQSRVDNVKKTIQELRERLAANTALIGSDNGAAEQLAKAEAAFEGASYQLAAVERRAHAAKLLYEALLRHRDEARRKYAAPFADKVRQLAALVYGGEVDFQVGDDLRLQERVHNGTALPIAALSGGAQEQLALIIRFAVAELVGDGASVPIFVDDVLGNTDSERLKLMNVVFSSVGQRNQVFVFTSMSQRFDRIAGAVSHSMDELKGGAI